MLEWQEAAACRGKDPDLFFPDVGQTWSAEARAICASCEVRVECLEHALAKPEQRGMWGGYSAEERRDLIRRRRASG